MTIQLNAKLFSKFSESFMELRINSHVGGDVCTPIHETLHRFLCVNTKHTGIFKLIKKNTFQ